MKGTVFQIHKLMERNNHFGQLELGSTFCGRRFPIPNLWDSLYFDCMTQDFLGPTLNLKSDMKLLKWFVRVLFLFHKCHKYWLGQSFMGFLVRNLKNIGGENQRGAKIEVAETELGFAF